jgi:hypothetical protein
MSGSARIFIDARFPCLRMGLKVIGQLMEALHLVGRERIYAGRVTHIGITRYGDN